MLKRKEVSKNNYIGILGLLIPRTIFVIFTGDRHKNISWSCLAIRNKDKIDLLIMMMIILDWINSSWWEWVFTFLLRLVVKALMIFMNAWSATILYYTTVTCVRTTSTATPWMSPFIDFELGPSKHIIFSAQINFFLFIFDVCVVG